MNVSKSTTFVSPKDPPPSYEELQNERYKNGIDRAHMTYLPPPPPLGPVTYIQENVGPGHQRLRIVQGPVPLVFIQDLGPHPCYVICPLCTRQVLTVTCYSEDTVTCSSVSFCCCCCFPFFCLPLCLPQFKDVEHTCPACHGCIGTYSRL